MAIERRAAGSLLAGVLILLAAGRADSGAAPAPTEPTWVYFLDKGLASPAAREDAVRALARTYDARAVERRRARRTAPGLFDARDLAVFEPYVRAVEALATRIRVRSRWLNAVSAEMTRDQAQAIAALPFVRAVTPVRRHRRPASDTAAPAPTAAGAGGFYGLSEAQIEQLNLVSLHERGFTGAGVLIGVLDTGFRRSHEAFNHPDHPLDVVAEWDFVNNDADTAPEAGDPGNQHHHGTWILGAIGAYDPGALVGTAYDASFILAKVEDVRAEYPLEEDWFAAGLEFIEANGGDVATSSVVIFDHYTQEELDGETSVMTIAMNAATENGVHCCQGAGNEGHDSNPATSRLIPPADAFQVITVGAVDVNGTIANFSSDGPTADGRVKPELLARGVATWTVEEDADSGQRTQNGTSLSTPVLAGAVACMVQARPHWTVDRLRERAFMTGDYFLEHGTFDPLYVHGYGILDAAAALAPVDSESFEVTEGLFLSGDLDDLASSDEEYVRIRAQSLVLAGIWAEIDVTGTAITDSPSEISLTVEAAADALPLQRITEMYNYDTNAFETVDTRPGSTTDAIVTIDITTDAGRFVEPGSREVRARIGYFNLGIPFVAWQVRFDHVFWFVTP